MIGYFRNIIYFSILILLFNLIIRSPITKSEGDLILKKAPMLENEHFIKTSVKDPRLINLIQTNSTNISQLKNSKPGYFNKTGY